MIEFRTIDYDTEQYDVEISKPMTVKEFIDELISLYPSEWGYVGIYKDGYVFGDPVCEYSHGEIKEAMPEEFLNREITYVDGGGGWSRSDFTLYLKEI